MTTGKLWQLSDINVHVIDLLLPTKVLLLRLSGRAGGGVRQSHVAAERTPVSLLRRGTNTNVCCFSPFFPSIDRLT